LLTLYYMPDTCALATHIALEEADAPFALKKVDFAKNEQRAPAYLAVNPKGRVPALATPQGVLTETPAMLAYVAQLYPAANLAPFADPFAFAKVQALNSYLCSTLHVAHAHRMRGYRRADDPAAIAEMRRKAPQAVGDCWATVEQQLFEGPYAAGAAYTIADPYLFTLAQWIEEDGVDIARFPRVAEHRARIAARPAVRKALAAEAA
jgi:glutathione S-transferase